ncbi:MULTISPECIES: S-layer homology domain-containing protein [Gordonibacter]|uniref:S-layer homology domain-containing protein n=1 Tax=Gordonibacter faecis TaxID=3047475 RepID=A0ABT7DRG6_9ACTN|nr:MULTISPECIES: S-layer homology domain-containing protein [unclassified Gordonibacter]MDJ1651857.1 S-layer homology domain-containing protein [Gordonibacter sp. KGMB12511]HIW75285.1 S-layer homology domain-containing protein [Candidatus Gordonibacter avicola]
MKLLGKPKRMTACLVTVALAAGLAPSVALAADDLGDDVVGVPVFQFSDVEDGAWYKDVVYYAYENGIMKGYAGTYLFGPDDTFARQDVACMLFKWLAPEESADWDWDTIPAINNDTTYSDASDFRYYTAPLNWVQKNELIAGYSDGSNRFGVGDGMTREQFAVILKRIDEKFFTDSVAIASLASSASTFQDYDEVSPWAQDAVNWACSKGLFTGDGGNLYPQRTITRAEAAKITSVYHQAVSAK